MYLSVAGSVQRGYFDLAKYALLSPLYWGLMSIAAWKGFLQLFYAPFYWEKTVHGLDAGHHPAAATPTQPGLRLMAVAARAHRPDAPPRPHVGHPARRPALPARGPDPQRPRRPADLRRRRRLLLLHRLPGDDRRPRRRLRRAQPPDRRLPGVVERPAQARGDRLPVPAADHDGVPAADRDQAGRDVAGRAAAADLAVRGRGAGVDRPHAGALRDAAAVPAAGAGPVRDQPDVAVLRGQRHERGGLPGDARVRAVRLRQLVRDDRAALPDRRRVRPRRADHDALHVHHLGRPGGPADRRGARAPARVARGGRGLRRRLRGAGRLRARAVDPLQRADRRRPVRLDHRHDVDAGRQRDRHRHQRVAGLRPGLLAAAGAQRRGLPAGVRRRARRSCSRSSSSATTWRCGWRRSSCWAS